MPEKLTERSLLSSQWRDASPPTTEKSRTSVCLVGGSRILRRSLELLLQRHDIDLEGMHENADSLEESLRCGEGDCGCDAILLLILSGGPFSTFHRIRETLSKVHNSMPLVVLSQRASRGEVYAALQIGAKAYVNFDAEPVELIKAINMAARGKVFLAPDAAQVLVNDVSTAIKPSRNSRLPSMELSRRESEIVQLLCEGLTAKQIAHRLHISPKTVSNHRYNIYRKCEVESIAGLMRHAIQQGLVSI